MRIEPGSKIAGFSLVRVRDAIARAAGYDEVFRRSALAKRLKCTNSIEPLIDALIEANYIQLKGTNPNGDCVYLLTESGCRLLTARAIAPLAREEADALLADVISKAAEINANPYYAHDVSSIYVFGSYLGDAPLLGDLDLAYQLSFKEIFADSTLRREALERMRRSAGREFRSPSERTWWPREAVRRALRHGIPHISLHTLDDLASISAKRPVASRLVFGNDELPQKIAEERRFLHDTP